MRTLLLATAPAILLLAACAPDAPKKAVDEAPKQAEARHPRHESRRFPSANLVDTKLVDQHLLGKTFMPGGTLAHYKRGKVEYEMFLARCESATEAAILLPDWRKVLSGAKLVPSFGGYIGQDEGRPIFVFTKRAWVAGVAGLPEKQADLEAWALAARLD